MTDLLAFKINSCGLRPTVLKRVLDAQDAVTIVNTLSANGRVSLDTTQRAAIRQGLDTVMSETGTDYAWWNSRVDLE